MSVGAAFRQARIHAARHMAASEGASFRWGEAAITEIVMARAATAVSVVPFTPRAEAISGADWIWWWVDSSAAYGMLVQAKRLNATARKWAFGFDYGHGEQRRKLRWMAGEWGLLPTYALYLGTGDSRDWQRCSSSHRSGRCLPCVQRTVSLMPALLAEPQVVTDAASTYERSIALEEVSSPSSHSPFIIHASRRQMSQTLEDFLTTPQSGVRAVTRSMMDRVLHARHGAFSSMPELHERAATPTPDERLGSVFQEFPADEGHWGLNYFQHVLSPLVYAPPSYVLEILVGDYDEEGVFNQLPNGLAGVVVVRLDSDGDGSRS